jgi:N-acetylneuraminic acid mutarotase
LKHISCNISGTSYNATADDTGAFKISNIPKGTYAVSFMSIATDFSLADTQLNSIVVQSDSNTFIGIVKMYLSSIGDPPTPIGLKAIYDSLSGTVALIWGSVPVPDFKNFIIFRENSNSSAGYLQIDSTRDTFFVDKINFADTVGYSVFYKVQCFDSSGGKSQQTAAITINANPPAGKTTVHLTVQDSAGLFDKIPLVATFSNKTTPVDTLIWTTSNGDSIHVINNTFGTDAIKISFADTGRHAIYFKTIDNLGRKSLDSTFVNIVQDRPVIKYLSPSQTVDFGGTVQCSLAVSHRFGACTLSVHLGNSLTDLIKSYTSMAIVYDTAFSTLNEPTWDSIVIKLTDSHGNVMDTGFSVTIRPHILPNEWEDLAQMNDHHRLHCSEVIDSALYVIGGCKAQWTGIQTDIWSPVKTVEAYDTVLKTWVTKDSMLTARRNFVTCVFNKKIYAIGGFGGFKGKEYVTTMEQFDPIANKWTVFDTMRIGGTPFTRKASASCIVGTKLYLFGGMTGDDSVCQSIYVYDFSSFSPQWSATNPMITPRHDFQAILLSGKVYLIGGIDASGNQLQSTEIFNPISQTCAPGPFMPVALSNFAAAVIDKNLYIIGGMNSESSGPFEAMYMYSLTSNSWLTKAPLIKPRHSMCASILNGNIYLSGGINTSDPTLGETSDKDFIKYYP